MILINNIVHSKANGIGHILRRNCLLRDVTEGQMREVKGVGRRRRRRRTQLPDDLRNIRRYWEIMEEAEDRKKVGHRGEKYKLLSSTSP